MNQQSGSNRGAKVVSNMNALKRKKNEVELDKLIPMNEQNDPFDMDGENDRDLDYVPSPKKAKKPQSSQKPTDSNKKLSPQERIARLKRKTERENVSKRAVNSLSQKNVEKSGDVPSNLQSDSIIEVIDSPPGPLSSGNHDHFFEMAKPIEVDNSLSKSANSRQDVARRNTTANDEFTAATQNSFIEILPESAHKHSNVTTDFRNGFSDYDIYLSLSEKIDGMCAELKSLRKQVTRMEAKCIINGEHRRATSSLHEVMDELSSFESQLSEEGLPIKNVDSVIALETRLKQSSFCSMPYRQKLVRDI